MTVLRAKLAHLEGQASEYETLARQATSTIERVWFTRLAAHYRQLASEFAVTMAATRAKATTEDAPSCRAIW